MRQLRRFRFAESNAQHKQSDMDDGWLYVQNRSFPLGKTLTKKSLTVEDEMSNSERKHLLLIDIVRRFPPDLHSSLYLRDEGILSLPRYAYQKQHMYISEQQV